MTAGPTILEIGHAPYLRQLLPERTCFIAVGTAAPQPLAALIMAGPSAIGRIGAFRRLVGMPSLRLIACRIRQEPGRSWALVRRLLLAYRPAAPIIVLDFEDEDIIHAANRPLIEAARLVFKRELPVDRWRLARRHLDRSVNEPALRRDPAARRMVEKLRPLPLGLPLDERRQLIPQELQPKAADLFFAGAVEAGAWERRDGLAELHGLAAEGFVVDHPDTHLSPEVFYRRCAAAWLTWSPAGHGWQCFRHSEAASCGSVPLMPYPRVACHAGLRDGEHAVFYDPRPGGLAAAARAALADHPRLARMAKAARQHVQAHHTPEAIAAYVLAESLGEGDAA